MKYVSSRQFEAHSNLPRHTFTRGIGGVMCSCDFLLGQARQAAAAALKCWVDAENWTPDLVTSIFTGGRPIPADGPLVMLLVSFHEQTGPASPFQ